MDKIDSSSFTDKETTAMRLQKSSLNDRMPTDNTPVLNKEGGDSAVQNN